MAQQQKTMPGGMGNVRPAAGNMEVKNYLDQVRAAAEEKAGRSFNLYEPTEYATQLVNGTNYFVKVDTGEGVFVFIRLHKPIRSDTVSFHSLRDGMTESDVLVYIQ